MTQLAKPSSSTSQPKQRQAQRSAEFKRNEIALSRLEISCAPKPGDREPMRTRAQWKDLGYRVPTKAEPAAIEWFIVPGCRKVERTQLRQLCEGDRTVYVTFDIDQNQSGQRAADQLVHRLVMHGISARRVLLPEGHDPNSFFVQGGDPHLFQSLLEAAQP